METGGGLLDEALGHLSRRVVLLEDCVDTSAAFVLHHILKRSLSQSPHSTSNAVVFVAFAHPFSHYDRILRRLGCNLAAQRDNNRFFFLDMLMDCPDEGKNSDCGLIALYGKIQKTGCSLIMLNHEDIYSGTAKPTLILQMEYLADILIRAEPLATGLASDVHGQLTVKNRGIYDGHEGSRNKVSNFQFKVKENGVEYFYPGSKT
ncbi:elongator complex protein 6-like isoform X2 [Pyrus communis]|uniref:elongator complex protein 6-like isoform X2 n=1 Tax=Pyrus communis TaxID=23211 RepID=UPI0035C11776